MIEITDNEQQQQNLSTKSPFGSNKVITEPKNVDEATQGYDIDRLRSQQAKLEQKRRERTQRKGTEKVGEYFTQLDDVKKKTADDIVRSIQKRMQRINRKHAKCPVSYEAARYIIWEAMKARLIDESVTPQFDGNMAEVIKNLIGYFTCTETKFDLKKGIYLWGNVGRGKSFLMSLLSVFCKEIEYSYRNFNIYSVKELSFKVVRDSNIKHLDDCLKGKVCLDDVGFEEKNVFLYKNSVPIMEFLVDGRYNLFQKTGMVTHMTSNVPPGLLETEYSKRVESRIHEMFNLVELKGIDKRKVNKDD